MREQVRHVLFREENVEPSDHNLIHGPRTHMDNSFGAVNLEMEEPRPLEQ